MSKLRELIDALGDRVLTEPAEISRFMFDSSRATPDGTPIAVVTAKSAQDVATALKWATDTKTPVSIRGAGTGLTGGAVSFPDGLVISMTELNSIISIDPANRVAVVEAGVVTSEIDEAAKAFGLMYAPDPASYRESTIGGNIATNAGGLRCVKYGVTADSIASLEVVLATGEIIETGSTTRKNVVGYDLTRLFVGSEGTLGVVTKATVRLRPRPEGSVATFRAVFPNLPTAGAAVTAIMTSQLVPDTLELMDRQTVEAVAKHYPIGLDSDLGVAMLIGQFIDQDALVQAAQAAELCQNAGATFVENAEGDVLLEARRFSGKALSAEGLRVSSDVAVPISRLADMFEAIEKISKEEGVAVPTFAHAGDGNLHPSVIVEHENEAARDEGERILDRIADAALALGGTLSGEHGIGSLKYGQLSKQLSESALKVQRAIRSTLDPAGILSPGRGI